MRMPENQSVDDQSKCSHGELRFACQECQKERDQFNRDKSKVHWQIGDDKTAAGIIIESGGEADLDTILDYIESRGGSSFKPKFAESSEIRTLYKEVLVKMLEEAVKRTPILKNIEAVGHSVKINFIDDEDKVAEWKKNSFSNELAFAEDFIEAQKVK